MSTAQGGRSIGAGGAITDAAEFEAALREMEPGKQDAQTSRTIYAAGQRAKATRDLAAVVTEADARTIVESLGGTLDQMRASAQRIARIVSATLADDRNREAYFRLADESRVHGAAMMRCAKHCGSAATEWAAQEAGTYLGLAFAAYERSEECLRLAGEIGR